jgi:hypothetical protein
MFIIKLLSQHVSGVIMPIIKRTRVRTAAYGVLHWLWWLWLCGAVCTVFTVHTACVPAPHNHSHHNQCRTPYAAVHTLVLLMIGIMMPETCWDKSLIINIRLVASCWFLSLQPKFMFTPYEHGGCGCHSVWLMPLQLLSCWRHKLSYHHESGFAYILKCWNLWYYAVTFVTFITDLDRILLFSSLCIIFMARAPLTSQQWLQTHGQICKYY